MYINRLQNLQIIDDVWWQKRDMVFLFKEIHSPLTKNLISVFVCPEGKRGGKGPKKVVSFCLFI